MSDDSAIEPSNGNANKRLVWGLNGYQWLVLMAAWLGWGFDVFDGLLFNYVAPTCIPTLLNIPLGTPEAKSATLQWTGIMTSVLLIGWATGGIIFGRIADRIGRTKTLLITIALFAIGTALCAFAQNIAMLLVCRIIASLGIGGEWAAGAAMVAEVVPEKKRVAAGALLYTSAPAGLFLATYVTYFIQGVAFPGSPESSWRLVFLCGLIPAFVAFGLRFLIKEPESFTKNHNPSVLSLFSKPLRHATFSGVGMALVALFAWWSCNAFIPVIAAGLAAAEASNQGLDKVATQRLVEVWKQSATNYFNLGGLIGTLLTVPVARSFGRRAMFGTYFAASAVALFVTFAFPWSGADRLYGYFFLGLSIFGVFGSFTYYLPELFPADLRATGAGFCYNSGRYLAAAGPFLVGTIAARGADGTATAMQVLTFVTIFPVLGVIGSRWILETKDRALATDAVLEASPS
jgi:MFS family permease